jgi:trehalose/maltose hydrolase-like predicted phosphorylase
VPEEVRSLQMSVQYRGGWVDCEMTASEMTITSRDGAATPIQVVINDEHFELAPGAVHTVSLG